MKLFYSMNVVCMSRRNESNHLKMKISMSRSKISIWNFVTRTVTHTYVHTLLVFIIGKIIPTRKTMDMCNAKCEMCVCVFIPSAAICNVFTSYYVY